MTRLFPALLLALSLLASPALAQSPDSRSPEDAARRERLEQAARTLLVHVRIFFQRDPEDPRNGAGDADGGAADTAAKQNIYSFLEEEQAYEVVGVVLGPATVVIGDLGVHRKYLKGFAVDTADGRSFPADWSGVLTRAPGWTLAVKVPAGEALAQPSFAAFPADPSGATLLTAWLNELDGTWRYGFGAASSARTFFARPGAAPVWVIGDPNVVESQADAVGLRVRPTHLLCDGEGRPVGAALHGHLDADPAGVVAWRGADLLADPGVSPARLAELEKQVIASCERILAEVEVKLRPAGGGGDDDEGAMSMFRRLRRRARADEQAEENRSWYYGFAIFPGRILVPAEITAEIAARIESIEVTIGSQRKTGTFHGAFREFAAFLVDLDAPLAEAPPAPDAADPPAQGRLLLAVEARRRFERKQVDVRLSRVLGVGVGYKDERHDRCDPAVAPGAVAFDFSGRPSGFLARRRKDDERLRTAAESGGDEESMMRALMSRRSLAGANADLRLWKLRDLAGVLAAPEPALDPHIRVKTREEEGRQVWFGVELSPLTPEVVQMLKIEGPTKKGAVGRQVAYVYEESPAARAGFSGGEILLQVRDKEKGDPLELPAMGEGGFHFDLPEELRSRLSEDGGPAFEAPWPDARDVLTGFLTAMGKGRPAVLTFLKDGAVKELEFTTEEGPADFEGAPRARHEPTGMSVRDLTYEVRRGLKLPREATGAVIARVEPGTPAAVSRLRTYDVVLRVDGKPISGAQAFVAALDEAGNQGPGSVKLQVLRFDKTRFVDLQVPKGGAEEGGKEAK